MSMNHLPGQSINIKCKIILSYGMGMFMFKDIKDERRHLNYTWIDLDCGDYGVCAKTVTVEEMDLKTLEIKDESSTKWL